MTTADNTAVGWDVAAERLSHARRIAKGLGRHDLVGRIDDEMRSASVQRPVTIVVVAETSRGKSSLINALLSMPDLLPVDSDATTGVYVLVGYAEVPELRVYTRTTPGPLYGRIDELAGWVSVTGNPENRKAVVHVEADVPCELLRDRARLADTPGVGGLDSAHGVMTLTALEGADAMLFVADALAPLSEPELAFLRRASQRIQTVRFALTKTDLNPLGWEEVLAEDRQLLKQTVPRFGNHKFFRVCPPDALRACQKRASGDEETARRLQERSGIEPLTAHLRAAVIQRAETLRIANGYRLAMSVLELTEADCRARRATLNGDPKPLADLRAAQDELAQLAQNTTGWGQGLRRDFEALMRSTRRTFREKTDDWRRKVDHEIEHDWRSDKHQDFPAELDASLRQIAVDVDLTLKQGILAATGEAATRLGIDDFPSPEATFVLPERELIPGRSSDQVVPTKSLVIGGLVLGSTASIVRSIIFSAGSPLALIMAPLSLGTTLSSVYALKTQGAQSKKAEARWLLKEYDARFRRDVSYAIEDTLRAACDEAEAGLRRTIEERRLTVQARIQKLTSEQNGAEGPDAARAQLDRRIEELVRVRSEWRQQLQGLVSQPALRPNRTPSSGVSTHASTAIMGPHT